MFLSVNEGIILTELLWESNEISMCEGSEFLGKEYITLGHDITSYRSSRGFSAALGVNLFFNTCLQLPH